MFVQCFFKHLIHFFQTLHNMKIKVELFGRIKVNGEQPIKIRLYHKGRNAYIDTAYSVRPEYFDVKTGIIINHPDNDFMVEANAALAGIVAKYSKAIKLLEDYADTMEITKFKALVLQTGESNKIAYIDGVDFYESAVKIITTLQLDGQEGHAANISTTISILQKYHGLDRTLPFEIIDIDFLKSFRRWYVPKHGKIVTFNKHLRNIKLIFNESRRKKIISRDIYPFDDFAIPTGYDAEIRCVDAKTIYMISQTEGLGRDVFMLSFYLCGMNLKDIVNLPYSSSGQIDTKRIKTIRSANPVRLRLKLHPNVQDIINRYQDPERKKLVKFPMSNYRVLNKSVNDQLKKIATELGIDTGLSYTYARHSFATIAGSLKIPDNVIDKALMHSGKGMIEKYRQFDYSIVDDALNKVVKEVFKHDKSAKAKPSATKQQSSATDKKTSPKSAKGSSGRKS